MASRTPSFLPALILLSSLALGPIATGAEITAPAPRAAMPAAPTYYPAPPAPRPATIPVQVQLQPASYAAAPVAVASGDPYGFTGWLNATRARYGLRPVGFDPNLAGWAATNNSQQAARGMGHHVMGPARRQNCAMGQAASIGAMWMASPAHQSALLDPSITMIGIAGLGTYWTFNAR